MSNVSVHFSHACFFAVRTRSVLADSALPGARRGKILTRKTFHIWAENALFDRKDALKRRRYRWNDGTDGRPRSWHNGARRMFFTSSVTKEAAAVR
jgi:hypothetical protein